MSEEMGGGEWEGGRAIRPDPALTQPSQPVFERLLTRPGPVLKWVRWNVYNFPDKTDEVERITRVNIDTAEGDWVRPD
jgi:hypothetical protein